jgi:SH3-like domain-containing protein
MQARVSLSKRAVNVPLLGSWVLVSLVVVLALSPTGLAQNGPDQSAPPASVTQPLVTVPAPGPAGTGNLPAGPYVAEATGNDVYIRSGPGTNFYQCGKLYMGDRVQVVSSQDGWSCIVPPAGSFSWISMQYVSINQDNPTMATVTGDNVGVYAGSDFVMPMHSTSKQVSLNRGQVVKLLGEEKDDYYKIAPPQGAYLWVSAQFVEAATPAVGRPPVVDVGAMVRAPAANTKVPADANAAPLTGLDLYYALNEQIKAERTKAPAEQNYAEIKKKLTELAADQASGRAARYAEYTLKQVERYELACKVSQEVALQNKELQKVTAKIDEARATKLAQIVDLSKYAITGKLENSSVYTGTGQARRYRVLDDAGTTICYVMPTGPAAGLDLSKFVGHKVGLVGKISPHEATARAFVEFSEIVQLD